jgi:glycosyltransferase involved in cell wall biosynthesis
MQISIITVNYNNKEGLIRTIESIRAQTSKLFEYIVVDGNSKDGSVNVISENEAIITKWISEEDTGIYNAMNKAIRLASGAYCIFMNSGDILYSKTTIEEILKLNFSEDYLLGGVISGQLGHIKAKKILTMADFVCGSIAHQASMIKRNLLLKYPYDENLTIVSDWKFCIQTLIFAACSYRPIDIIIAKEEPNGISSGVNENHKSERNSVLNSFLPDKVLVDYISIKKIRKKPFIWILNYLNKE